VCCVRLVVVWLGDGRGTENFCSPQASSTTQIQFLHEALSSYAHTATKRRYGTRHDFSEILASEV